MKSTCENAGLNLQTAPCGLLLLLPILLIASWVHFPNGWVFTSTGGGWEYPVFLAVASVVHALAGDGVLALKLLRLRFATSAA